MGGSSSKSDSESSSGGTFNQRVWEGQGDALEKLYGQLGGLFDQSMGGMTGLQPGASDYMNQIRDQSMPFWQDQMAGGAYQGMNLQGQYNQALNNGGGNEQFVNEQVMGGAGNDYADAMRGQVMDNAQNLTDQMLQSTDARAAASGMSGGSRQGVLQSNGMDDINTQAQNQLTNIGYNTFDKNLDRMSGIAQRADQYDMNRLNNISGMLGNQQNTMNQGLVGAQGQQGLGMGAFNPYNAPWQTAGSYANAIGRPTVLGSGSMSGNSDSSSKGMSVGMGK